MDKAYEEALGGSYVVDPKSGKRTRKEFTADAPMPAAAVPETEQPAPADAAPENKKVK